MTEVELYEKASENILETLKLIEAKDTFLYREIESIYDAIDRIPKNCFKDNLYGPLPSCTTEQSILLVQKFLRLCNKKYEQQFIKDLHDKKIIIDENNGTICEYIFKKDGTNDYVVYVEKTGTIKDAYKLLHEYFHALNQNRSYFRFAMTESISITAELIFLDFLEREGISRYDLALTSAERKSAFNNNCNYLKILFPLYIEVIKKGRIDNKTYDESIKPLIKKETFLSFLKTEILETKNHDRLLNIRSYRHCIGYMYASAFHNEGFNEKKLAIANDSLLRLKERRFSSIISVDDIIHYPYYRVRKELDNFLPTQSKKA